MDNNTGDLISIVVPVYNVETYLRQCVDSVLQQTYSNIEVILVDDGSTDLSGSVCDEYATQDERVRVIHKKNGGLSDARNAGIEVAQGEYVGFVDSDDWIEADMVSCLYDACAESGADIAVAGFFRDFVGSSYINVGFDKETLSGSEALYRLIEGRQIQDYACTKLYRLSLWKEIRFPFGKHYEDIRTVYRVFESADTVCTVPKALYHYRQRSGSISSEGLNSRKMEWLEAIREQENVLAQKMQGDGRLRNCFERKTLYTKGCILLEWLLIRDRKVAKEYKITAKQLYRTVRQNRRRLSDKESFSKTIRLIARLSIFPLSFQRMLFGSSVVRRRVTSSFKPYS